MNNIIIIEDHDEALKCWRRLGAKNIDLVHVDAHIDYCVPPARPVEDILNEVSSVKELKLKLEYTFAFQKYQKDLASQTDIGNYIHLAMQEGIVRNFTWVIPGCVKNFSKYASGIRDVLRVAAQAKNRKDRLIFSSPHAGMLTAEIFGRKFSVCVLEALPVFSSPVLLDIDTDFFVIPNILEAAYTRQIGKRNPWIMPSELVKILKAKVWNMKAVTIAYSVNGGWTPMKFKYLGDDLAYQFSPAQFERHFVKRLKAAGYFYNFEETGKKIDYQKAAYFNPSYRAPDNNYGLIYMDKGQFVVAKKEFQRILKVDSRHAGALWGMGILAQRKKNYKKARIWFRRAYQAACRYGVFRVLKNRILFSLAQAEFYLNDFKNAKRKLENYCRFEPLDPRPNYLLGLVAQKEKRFEAAAQYYCQAVQLGCDDEKPVMGLIKIVRNLPQRSDIIKYIRKKYSDFRGNFRILEQRDKKKKVLGLERMRKVLHRLEKRITKFQDTITK